MDNILWWLEDRVFYDFIIYTIIEIIYYTYVHNKVRKLLGKNFNELPFMNKTLKTVKIIIGIIVLFIMVAGILKIVYGSSFVILIFPTIFFIIYWLLTDRLSSFNFNDNGIIMFPINSTSIIGIEAMKWDSITKLAVDKDINQKVYGFWIYADSLKNPGRFWVDRRYISQVIELFKKYNVGIEERV